MAENASQEQTWEVIKKLAPVWRALKNQAYSSSNVSSGIFGSEINEIIAFATYLKSEGIKIENVDADTLAKKIAAEIEPKLSLTGSAVSGPQTSLGPINYEHLAGEIARHINIPSVRMPYIKLAAEWTYPEPETDKKNIDSVNDIFTNISKEWEPSGHYIIEEEKRGYGGKIELTDKEEDILDEGNALDISMFFKNKASPNLSLGVKTDLDSYDLNLYLTSFHPEFIQGVHDLEKHFEKKDTGEFVKLLNYLEKQYYEDGERKTEDDISVVEYADLYEKWSP